MTIDYAAAGDLLATLERIVEHYDGDLLVSLLAEHAELRPGPFDPPLVGRNAIRAYWASSDTDRRDSELTIERHWVNGSTILTAWDLGFLDDRSGTHVRLGGFATIEVSDGGIERIRVWWRRDDEPIGR